MNELERILIMVKGFSNRNALERILIYECIGKGMKLETIEMHWKGFYNRNEW